MQKRFYYLLTSIDLILNYEKRLMKLISLINHVVNHLLIYSLIPISLLCNKLIYINNNNYMMQAVEKIDTSELLASAFSQLNRSLINLISPSNLALLHLEELFPPYRAAVEKFELLVNKTLQLPQNREIAGFETYRDRLLRRLFSLLRDFRKSSNSDEQYNGVLIWEAISVYENIMDNEMSNETNKIKNLLYDLDTPAIKEAVVFLNLENLVAQLKNNDEEMEIAKLKRMEIQSLQIDITTKRQRNAINDLQEQVIQRINAVSNLEPCDEIDELIETINSLFDEYSHAPIHMRTSGVS